jgi:topoisomerase-4 subunit A
LGQFDGDDKILTVDKNGTYELSGFELSNHFEGDLQLIEKYNPDKAFSVIYIDGKSKNYYLKRFTFENSTTNKKVSFISEDNGSKLVLLSGLREPKIAIEVLKGKSQTEEKNTLNLTNLIDIKGMKALGNRLSLHVIKNITLIESSEPEEELNPIMDTDNQSGKHSETIQNSEIYLSQKSTEFQKPIDLEITNPDDIKIDDKGQLGLF